VYFAEVYGASVSKDTVSRITDAVVEDMQAWTSRPLQSVYAAVFVDAIHVKVRDGQVGNRPFYAAIGVDLQASVTCWACGPTTERVSRRSSGWPC
jgi:transposase-like protein